ncbi:MAG: hypothetical protein QGH45_21175, partial [Myxococcota bacterium]|nr:hypothetical protein [Myxococcota bacterium]
GGRGGPAPRAGGARPPAPGGGGGGGGGAPGRGGGGGAGGGGGGRGLALLPLNPMVLSMPQLDENLLALSFSMALMPVVVAGGRGGWGAAGALFALVLAMRHVMLPATPALLLAAWQSRGRGRALAWLVATLGVTTLPVTLHHSLALGSPLRFESNAQFPVFGYQLAGIDFGYQGLMNWPFADQLVRTPHNPFPMLVLWPLTVADHLGLILFAALVVGAGALWWLSPRKGAFWLLWSWAVVGGLLFQEGWDCKNKMWVLIIVFGAFVAWIVAAGEAVRRQPAWVLPPMLAIALAGWGAARGLGDWEVPADARYVCVEPATCAENPAQLAEDRRLATRLGALPDLRRLGHNGPFLAVAKIRDLFRSLADPGVVRDPLPWGWFPGETPPPGTPVTVRIDLSDAPHGRVAFLGLTDEPADVDLTDGGGPLALRGVRVPWDERKLTLYLDANRELAVAVAFYDGDLPYPACGAETESRAERIRSQRAWALAVLLGEEEDPELQPRARTFDEPVVRVQVPGGALSFAMEKHLGPDRLLLWKAVSHGGGIDVEAPFEPWDN